MIKHVFRIITAATITFFIPTQNFCRYEAAAAENGTTGSPRTLAIDARADSLVIHKKKRMMQLYMGGANVKNYPIALGFEPVGPKQKQGDGRTPEGRYTITERNPESIYHLSFRISYPEKEDMQRSRKAGVNPGGDIFIHGWPDNVEQKNVSLPTGDWTRGCIAVTNEEVEELWCLVSVGTPVVIYP